MLASEMRLAGLALFASAQAALASGVWYVDGVDGSNDNNCKSRQEACKTIEHAISLASPGDFISVAAATYVENLGIPFSLEIAGSGAAATIIDGGRVASVVLSTNPSAQVILSGMTLRNGGGLGDGAGIYNDLSTMTLLNITISGNNARRGSGSPGFGGGIYNTPGSTLTVINSTFSGNSAEEGGAICNGGKLTIANSSFVGNTAIDGKGGGIRNYRTLTINNSTFSGNSVPGGIGGAIHNGEYVQQTGTLAINNSTISGNTAGDSGGIFNLKLTTTVIQNSIVANNSGGNCGGVMTSNGYNLSSDSSCSFDGAGDLSNTDPYLGPLQDNGGPTQTMALLEGSPAIDTGNPGGCTDGSGQLLKTDQRGKPRPDKEDSGGCDRGAYERQKD